MTSLKKRIAGKQRRRAVVPVLVSDPTTDRHLYMGAVTALAAAQQRGADQAELDALGAQVAEQETAVHGHTAEVEVLALGSARWEELTAQFVNKDGDGVDWRAALPVLLAESCKDDDLRDAEWWAEQLASDAWSEGDVDALRLAVLYLNVEAPDPRVPKG